MTMACPNCGHTPRGGYPLPNRTGERVVMTRDAYVSPGPSHERKKIPRGAQGTIVGGAWPKGYRVEMEDGAKVILLTSDFHRSPGSENAP